MFTPQEIRDTEFDKIVRGYNPDDVDAFLSQIADQIESLQRDKVDAENKMMMLAERLEGFKKDEDTLRSALFTAERLKEAVMTEARQKSDILLNDAQVKADQLIAAANQQLEEKEAEYESLQSSVTEFKRTILGTYKKHLEMLSELPEIEEQLSEAALEIPEMAGGVDAGEGLFSSQVMEHVFGDTVDEAPAAESSDLFAFNVDEEAAEPEAELEAETEVTVESEKDEVASHFGKLDFGENFAFEK